MEDNLSWLEMPDVEFSEHQFVQLSQLISKTEQDHGIHLDPNEFMDEAKALYRMAYSWYKLRKSSPAPSRRRKRLETIRILLSELSPADRVSFLSKEHVDDHGEPLDLIVQFEEYIQHAIDAITHDNKKDPVRQALGSCAYALLSNYGVPWEIEHQSVAVMFLEVLLNDLPTDHSGYHLAKDVYEQHLR